MNRIDHTWHPVERHRRGASQGMVPQTKPIWEGVKPAGAIRPEATLLSTTERLFESHATLHTLSSSCGWLNLARCSSANQERELPQNVCSDSSLRIFPTTTLSHDTPILHCHYMRRSKHSSRICPHRQPISRDT